MEVMKDNPLMADYRVFLEFRCGAYIACNPCVSAPYFKVKVVDDAIYKKIVGIGGRVWKHFNEVWK